MERPRLAPYPERPRPSFSELFRTQKPLIGVVHLKPLPGSPGYDGLFLDLLDAALTDARTIESAGAAGLIVENFGDTPFYPEVVPPETVAAMTRLVTEIRKAVRIPVGVNVLRNDARAGVAVAAATGAGFVRVNVHTGVMVTDQGILAGRAWESVRLRETLRSRTLLFADIRVKHGEPLVRSELVQEAQDLIYRGRADALIVTGPATGRPADLEQVREIKKRLPAAPVLVGSGVDLTSIEEVLDVADGCLVGTAIKMQGRLDQPVEFERVRALAEVAERLAPRITPERPPRGHYAGGPPRGEGERAPARDSSREYSAREPRESREWREAREEPQAPREEPASPAEPYPATVHAAHGPAEAQGHSGHDTAAHVGAGGAAEVASIERPAAPVPAHSSDTAENGPETQPIQFGRGLVRKRRR